MDLEELKDDFLTDPRQQQKVLAYFEALKASPDGWKSCVKAVLETNAGDHVKFLCFQVLEYYLKTRFPTAAESDVVLLRDFFARWLQQYICSSKTELPYVRNKMAQLLALLFVAVFPARWPNFMQEVFLQNLSTGNVKLVELYLRVLLAIDTDVADKDIQRTSGDAERNASIKDHMRLLCIDDLVNTWHAILAQSLTNGCSNGKIASLCLNAIGSYIAWIEIKLIANDRFMPLIVACIKQSETQEAACDCLCSILSKGMEPLNKVELMQAVDNFLLLNGVFKDLENHDVEGLVKMAEVVNCIGTVLIECWTKFIKSGEMAQATVTLGFLESKLPQMLVFLNHCESDVSGAVAEFAHQYISVLKQLDSVESRQQQYVKDMLGVVLERYKYPNDFNFQHGGEDEAQFEEYRKDLRVIFTNIGLLEPDLTVATVGSKITHTFSNWPQMHYTDVEMSLSLLYHLAEALPSSHGNLLTPTNPRYCQLKNLVTLMVTSGVSQQKHVAVSVQFFETVCRYDKLFATDTQLIPDTLTAFLDERGLHHISPSGRSRAAYLFSRFVKSVKSALQQYVGEILLRVQDLLVVSPLAQTEPLLTCDDQLFLYEATGTLIVSGNFTAEQKKHYMEQLLGSLWQRFDEGLSLLANAQDDKTVAECTAFLNNVMAFASRSSKAFSNQMTMAACDCSDIFMKMMMVFLNALDPRYPQLLNGVRQYLHRMVICLENELLPHLPVIIQRFLVVISEFRALQDFLVLLQQIVTKYKKSCEPFMHADLPHVYQAVWTALSQPGDSSDETLTRDVQYLRRVFYQFLSAVATHQLLELLINIDHRQRDQVFIALLVGATQLPDPVAQKSCFSIFHKLIDCAKTCHNAWLDQLLWEKVAPACLGAPRRAGFDFADAQCVLVLGEISACFNSLLQWKGDYFVDCLRTVLLPQIGIGEVAVNEFIASLRIMDAKAFQKYLKNFFMGIVVVHDANSR